MKDARYLRLKLEAGLEFPITPNNLAIAKGFEPLTFATANVLPITPSDVYFIGRSGRNRTLTLLIRIQVIFQLIYASN